MAYKAPTKKVSDVTAYVKRQFGDEAGVQITDADIIRWVNAAQTEIVENNQVLKATATKTTTADVYDYALGVDVDIQYINSLHIDGAKLKYMNFNEAEELILRDDPARTARGRPEIWYEWAGIVNLYPTPDKGYTLTVFYHKLPLPVAAITDTLSLPDNYFNRIVEYVMSQAFELDENFSAMQIKTTQFEGRLNNMNFDENVAKVDTYPTITIRSEDL